MKPSNGLRAAQLVAAAVAVVALTSLTACSSDSDGDTDSSGSANVDSTLEAPAGAFPGNAASGTPVKIGFINAEGGQAISTPEYRETAEATVKYANENFGGIGGHPIELDLCKGGDTATSARDCANRMVEDKVSAVIVASTGLGDSIAPIVSAAGIPYISASGQSQAELTGDKSFMWAGGFPDSLSAMGAYAGEQGMKKVTAFTIDVPAAVGGLESMGVPAFAANGVELKVIPIPLGTPDATPQISAGLSSNPEGVVIVGDETLCTSALKALNTLGSTADLMVNQSCAAQSLLDTADSGVEGAHVFSAADIVSDDPEAVLYRAVMDKYAPDTKTQGFAYVGYSGVLGLVRATQSLDGSDTSSTALIDAIRGANDVVLPVGHGITFACNGTAAPALPAVCSKGSIVLTVEDGELVDPQVIGA